MKKFFTLLALCLAMVMGVQAGTKEIYAVWDESTTTLTLRYDDQRSKNHGVTDWSTYSNVATVVSLDETMSQALPTSTNGWFKNFKKLTKIENLNLLHTYQITDMTSMFAYCESLTSLDLSNFSTVQVTSMDNMFSVCKSLKSLDLSSFNTQKVTDMRFMFNCCSSLQSITFGSSFNTVRVTNMSYMFADCLELKSLDLSSFNTSQVTDMEGMFKSCKIKSLDLSSFNTEKVTRTDNMFYDGTGLESITFGPKFNTANVTNMSRMFYKCSLTSLDLSMFNTEKVEYMKEMFFYCSHLKSLDLSNFNTENVKDMTSMFEECFWLKTLNLLSFKTPNVEKMDRMFYGCKSLETIICNYEWYRYPGPSSENMFYFCPRLVGGWGYQCNGLEDINNYYARPDGFDFRGYFSKMEVYTDFVESTQTLTFYYDHIYRTRTGTVEIYDPIDRQNPYRFGNYQTKVTKAVIDPSMKDAPLTSAKDMFYGGNNHNLSALTEIAGLENLKTYLITDMSGMFRGCTALQSLNLSKFNTMNVTDMSNMFYACYALKSLDLRSFNTGKVTNMEGMFYRCRVMTQLTINPYSFQTANVTNMNSMFAQCHELQSLDLSKFNTEKVTDMSHMFDDSYSLISLNLRSFKTANVTDMSRMFYRCEALTLLDLSNFTAPKVTDMSEMFRYCHKLKSIYCPNTWKQNSGVMTYSENMFSSCTNLVGGRGTAYDSGKTDKEYARPDASGQKGYFIAEAKKIYTEYNADTKTLTYYCDGLYNSRSGIIEYYEPATVRFANYHDQIEKAVIDPSMQDTLIRTAENMFDGQAGDMINLTEITGLENLNTSKTTNMNYMFAGCRKLKSLDLSNFNTENVVLMLGMFNLCESLTVLDLSSFKINSLTATELMFANCSELLAIINGDDWNGVAHPTRMFLGCSKLKGGMGSPFNSSYDDATYARPDEGSGKPGYFTSPDMPKKVYTEYDGNETLTYFYDGLYNVREGTLEDYDPINKPNANRFYGYINNIKKVVIDESMEKNELASGYKMFFGLTQVTEIEDLYKLNTSNMTNMGMMFYNCKSLQSVYISRFDTENVTDMSCMFYGCNTLEKINVTRLYTENVTDMSDMFNGCSKLNPLNILYYANTSNVTNMSGMFQGCGSLTLINLGGLFSTINVTDMSRMFRGCSTIQVIDLSNFNTEKVTDMTEMFAACGELTSLDVSKFDTKNVEMLYNTFAGCKRLRSLDVSHFDTQKVLYMEGLFRGCAGLTEIDLSNFNTENVKSMSSMFEGCTSLTTLDLYSFNTSKVEYMRSMFYGCSALTTIYCQEDWRTKENLMDVNYLFGTCYNLVGGMGTPYDSRRFEVESAHPDGGEEDPGYFTLKADPTGMESIQNSDIRIQKIIRNGQLFIERDGKTYNVQGVEVR